MIGISCARPWLVVGIPFVAAFVLLFWPTFAWMAERFDAHDSFYSHGWLIPVASGWLIWQRRDRLQRLMPQASFAGLWLLVPSVALHVIATWWRLGFVSGFAMVGAVWGLVWTVWGRQVLHAVRFPLLFLLFMVPLPGVLLIATSFKMKLMAASWSAQLLNLIGFHVVQAGSTLHVPGATSVIIDDTCSGLRSLISLIALSSWWTALLPPSARLWHKAVMVAASIPLALVANMVRIVMLVFITAVYGRDAAEGFMHYGSGFVVFGVAVAALAWLGHWLVRSPADRQVAG